MVVILVAVHLQKAVKTMMAELLVTRNCSCLLSVSVFILQAGLTACLLAHTTVVLMQFMCILLPYLPSYTILLPTNIAQAIMKVIPIIHFCTLYTSDAAEDLLQ